MKKLIALIATILTIGSFAQVSMFTVHSKDSAKRSVAMYKSIMTETTYATDAAGEYSIYEYYRMDNNPNSPTFREYINMPLENIFVNADILIVDITKKLKWDSMNFSSLIMSIRQNGIYFILPPMAPGMMEEEVYYSFPEIDNYLPR